MQQKKLSLNDKYYLEASMRHPVKRFFFAIIKKMFLIVELFSRVDFTNILSAAIGIITR
jgi:hypothetical protein